MAFDILYRDGRDLTGRPLHDRPARLPDVVAGSELVFPVRRLAADGLEAWGRMIAPHVDQAARPPSSVSEVMM